MAQIAPENSARVRLEDIVDNAIVGYHAAQDLLRPRDEPHNTSYELAEPLTRVINLLEQEGNFWWAVGALKKKAGRRDDDIKALAARLDLAGRPMWRTRRLIEEVAKDCAVVKYEALMLDLKKLAAAVPPPPPPDPNRCSNRPSKTRDLNILVDRIADGCGEQFHWGWALATEGKDKNQWRPTNTVSRLVYAAVMLVDPGRINQVPEVMRKVTSDRKLRLGLSKPRYPT
jgi:hypothetical protein